MSSGTDRDSTQRKPIGLALACLAMFLFSAACGREAVQRPTAPHKNPASTLTYAPSAEVAEPVEVRIPAIGVDARIVPVGLAQNGDMQTPDFGLAGWYSPGPKPGEIGPAVVVAHVDSKKGPDVFFRLKELRPGDRISIHQADDRIATFEVTQMEQTPKNQLPVGRIWSAESKPVIRLLTCAGEFDRRTRHYRDNIIVYGSMVVEGGAEVE